VSQAIQTPNFVVSGDLYAEVRTFYARQMRLLDQLDIQRYAETFTEDGVVDHASRGERAQGRAAMIAGMRQALPRYAGIAVRHFFDHLLIEPLDDERLSVTYYSLVTRTDAAGAVVFEPTFTVEDVLVRVDGALAAKSRTVYRDGAPA